MKSDLFHLMPTDASVNQNRGNLGFDNGGIPEGEAPGTFLDGDSFEPRDEVKGDVARAVFYMDLRYEGAGTDPDLEILDSLPSNGSVTIGDLCTLYEWHTDDPVSAAEMVRNDRTEAKQGNRNVLIDEPELIDAIYGADCDARPLNARNTNESTTLPPSTSSDSLRIGTWNIANLHHETGIPLRAGAFARDEEDYERLAALVSTMALDIVALQEVGSPAAVRRIFPEDEYHVVMSERYNVGDEQRPIDGRDIFTAMVFSKARFPTVPVTSTLNALAITHIGFDRDGTPSARPTRSGIITNITLSGEPVKILGVHLKSFCHRWSLDPIIDQSPSTGRPFDSRFDCRTLRAQLSILESWIEQQSAQGITTIVLGDFNREMNAVNNLEEPIDQFWLDLNDGTPNDLSLSKGPLGTDEVCWPNHPRRFEEHIDLIIYDNGLSDLAALTEPIKLTMGFENDPKYADKTRQRLSDHCPVLMTITE